MTEANTTITDERKPGFPGPGSLFSVLFDDECLLVANKASGLAVIPERWESEVANLLDLVRALRPEALNVHRIDKETSGLVLFALDKACFSDLQAQFEKREVEKIYHALVCGRPSWDRASCDRALLPDGDRAHRTVVSSRGKVSETLFAVLERFGSYTLLEARPLSGRTHQIRAHAAALGFPLLGDPLYGGPGELRLSSIKPGWKGDRSREKPLIDRVALHAAGMSFRHPGTSERLEFSCPYPKDFAASLRQLSSGV